MDCNDEIYWYCSKCISLDIRNDKNGIPYCHSCGADVYTVDSTTFDRWNELYIMKYGHPMVERKTVYDDIAECFKEDGYEVLTEEEALNNAMCVGEFRQRKIKE